VAEMRKKLIRFGIFSLVVVPSGLFAASEQCQGLEAVAGAGACNDTALTGRLNTVIDTLFIVVGTVAVLILIMGGIRYITSTGDAKRIQAAKDTILYAVIGLIVVILARAIVGFVVGKIG
jgi:hypothetical protein